MWIIYLSWFITAAMTTCIVEHIGVHNWGMNLMYKGLDVYIRQHYGNYVCFSWLTNCANRFWI